MCQAWKANPCPCLGLPLRTTCAAHGGIGDRRPRARSTSAALERIEQRLIKGLRGVGAAILHDLAIPATGTTIDHLCIAPTGITAIDVERDSEGDGPRVS